MQDSPTNLICRQRFDTQELVTNFPPQLHNANKNIVYNLACPPGCSQGGQLMFSRWRRMTLPRTISVGKDRVAFEAREDVFGYEPTPVESPVVEWYLNFADRELFCAYGGPLFAQDEMQVAEHPALGSLREALLQRGIKPWTVEDGESTPILVMGVERRCEVATDCDAALGRPFGLYGNEFARAGPEVIQRATRPIDPPTITNLIAMEAPACGVGEYGLEQINDILSTAFTGYSAARIESRRADTQRAQVVVHTGFWGCGAYGGNRVLMALLQLMAACLAEVDRLVFHTHHKTGSDAFEQARGILERDLMPGGRQVDVSLLLRDVQAMGFSWGVSDGN